MQIGFAFWVIAGLLILALLFILSSLARMYRKAGPHEALVIYGSLRRWSPQHFRATLQGYFLPASLVGLLGYAAAGLWVPAVTRYFLLALPGILVAIVIGRVLNHRLRGDRFFQWLYVGLLALGGILIAQALTK